MCFVQFFKQSMTKELERSLLNNVFNSYYYLPKAFSTLQKYVLIGFGK